jgi:hypothetical protein
MCQCLCISDSVMLLLLTKMLERNVCPVETLIAGIGCHIFLQASAIKHLGRYDRPGRRDACFPTIAPEVFSSCCLWPPSKQVFHVASNPSLSRPFVMVFVVNLVVCGAILLCRKIGRLRAKEISWSVRCWVSFATSPVLVLR